MKISFMTNPPEKRTAVFYYNSGVLGQLGRDSRDWIQFPEPQLDDQHCIGWNQAVHSRIAIGEMRTDAYLAITTRLHADQRVFHAGHRFPAYKRYLVID